MKAILQRVTRASVTVDSQLVGNIGPGLVALVGIAVGDTVNDAQYLAKKTAELRIFTDDNGKFNLSVQDIKGSILAISQFTLLADTRKGRRPSFIDAANPEQAELLFNKYVEECRKIPLTVNTGKFQSHMLVEIHNDGPVTIILDSRDIKSKK